MRFDDNIMALWRFGCKLFDKVLCIFFLCYSVCLYFLDIAVMKYDVYLYVCLLPIGTKPDWNATYKFHILLFEIRFQVVFCANELKKTAG